MGEEEEYGVRGGGRGVEEKFEGGVGKRRKAMSEEEEDILNGGGGREVKEVIEREEEEEGNGRRRGRWFERKRICCRKGSGMGGRGGRLCIFGVFQPLRALQYAEVNQRVE